MDNYDRILRLISSNQRFVVSTHINPDGDAIGSELVLYSFLTELNKKVWIINTDTTPSVYSFLPNVDQIKSVPPFEQADVLIVLDAGALKRIGSKLSTILPRDKIVVSIDHHVTNDSFADYNLIEANACATCEILYRLIKRHGMPIGKERAICLYTGIMDDTGCFRYSNTTPTAHRVVAELISEGVRVNEIYRRVYETVPQGTIYLLAKVLNTLELTPDGKIAWFYVNKEMFKETGTKPEDVEGFTDYPRSIDTVDVVVFLRELEDGKTKVSFRSQNNVTVDKIAADYGGGGHKYAAGCVVDMPYDKLAKVLVAQCAAMKLENSII